MTAPYRTIPIEPTVTPAMEEAFFDALPRWESASNPHARHKYDPHSISEGDNFAKAFRAALAAAPPPPEDRPFTVTPEMIAAGNKAGGPMADNVEGVYRAMRALAPEDRLLAEAVKALEPFAELLSMVEQTAERRKEGLPDRYYWVSQIYNGFEISSDELRDAHTVYNHLRAQQPTEEGGG